MRAVPYRIGLGDTPKRIYGWKQQPTGNVRHAASFQIPCAGGEIACWFAKNSIQGLRLSLVLAIAKL